MADPLSIGASVLAVVTAAIKSAQSLREAVGRYRDRDRRLQKLQGELQDLTNILTALQDATSVDTSIFSLLEAPVQRCHQLCSDFEKSMKAFSEKSTLGIRDWAKLEFRRGDINDFLDTLMGYKSTLSVGLGTVTMRISRLSKEVLENYHEMIKDTTYSLELHLQRIDEKMANVPEDSGLASATIDLRDEKAVTEQCLAICENARSFLQNLKSRAPALGRIPSHTDSGNGDHFEAQIMARQALDDNRERLAETVGRLTERLCTLGSASGPEHAQLQQDISISKQCLEVCKMASNQASKQKVYKIGEATADGDSDQVVVSTMADFFDVKKALAKENSAQLIGLMSEESLQQLSRDRYGSRFGAKAEPQTTVVSASIPNIVLDESGRSQQGSQDVKPPVNATNGRKPLPNEIRRRTTSEDENENIR